MKITIYTPESSIRSPRKMLKEMWSDLLTSRQLAWQLTVRDIQSQYRQSILGIFWAFLLPLANTIVWIFLQGTGIINVGTTDIPYPVYVFTGTLLWSIFMESTQAPLTQINASKNILAKINFPSEAIILTGIYQTLFNAIIKVFLIIGAMLIIGIYPSWTILFFPIAILSLILAGTTIGLFITPVGMLYTDIGKAIPLFLQFFMFITPVVFPIPYDGWVSILFAYNPMTPLIMTCRHWLTGHTPDFINGFILVNLILVFILFLVWIIFRIAKPILSERMGA